MTRIAASPLLAYTVLSGHMQTSLCLFVYCSVTDGVSYLLSFKMKLDGWIARKFKQHTVLGTILDPLADKLMVGSLTAALTYTGLFPRTP